jgi:hypothetical protein
MWEKVTYRKNDVLSSSSARFILLAIDFRRRLPTSPSLLPIVDFEVMWELRRWWACKHWFHVSQGDGRKITTYGYGVFRVAD